MDPGNSLAPSLDIREVQKTFIDYRLELIADPTVMRLLSPNLALKVQRGPEISTAEELAIAYLHGSEALRAALREFVARQRGKAVMQSQAPDLCLFDDSMPAVSTRFVGRSHELRRITDDLLSYEPRSVVIRGVYGIGKTTLARQAIADPRVEELYDIAWVPCAEVQTLGDLDKRLGPLRYARPSAGRNPMRLHRPITAAPSPPASHAEAPPKRILIVLDRIDKLAESHRHDFKLSDFLAKLEQHRELMAPRLLITLDGSHHLGIVPINIELEPLYGHEAELFFTSFEFTSRWREEQSLEFLVRRFAGHPLALAIAARAAPKDGDIETYLVLLQRQHSPGEDELDVALRLLLLDSSLQHPKTREILQPIAYWPQFQCPRDVICAVLGLPDLHAVIDLADPASKMGLVRCTLDRYGIGCGGSAYEMLKPFRDRLYRFCPLSADQLSTIRQFVFGATFLNPEWGSGGKLIFARFGHLDKIFKEAFKSPDLDVVTSALDAVLSVPRVYGCGNPIDWIDPQVPLIRHQLRISTLKKACTSAERLHDSQRLQLLSLLFWEEEASVLWAGLALPPTELAGLRATLEGFLAQASDIAEHAVRKCCYLLAVRSSMDAESATCDKRPSFLRQALQYLDAADREPKFESVQDCRPYWFLTAPWEILVGRVQTEMLRIHLLMQSREPGRAHHAYCTMLAALDNGQAAGLKIGRIEILVRLDVAAIFAAHGALGHVGDLVDVALRRLPDYSFEEGGYLYWYQSVAYPYFILFRYFLSTHKDAPLWMQQDVRYVYAPGYLRWHVHPPPDSDHPRPRTIDCCVFQAEHACFIFRATGEIATLYRVWLWSLCSWSARIEQSDVVSVYCAILEALSLKSPANDWLPAHGPLSSLEPLLPKPEIGDPSRYLHSVAAVNALFRGDFSKARLVFLLLQETWLHDLPPVEDDDDCIPIFNVNRLFPVAVRISVWNDLFAALAEDCLRRASHGQRQLLAQGSDALNDGSSDKTIITTRKDFLPRRSFSC